MTGSKENTGSGTDSRAVLKVFLFTDLVGSTDLKERLGDVEASRLIAAHDDVFREHLERFGGTERVNPGDEFFATFDLPSAALRCALGFVDGLAKLEGSESLQVRVGVHMGETARVEGMRAGPQKLIGLAVDTAARVMGLAQPGQILLTRHVFDSVRQHVSEASDGSEVQWLAHGGYQFKGVGESLEVFEAGVRGLSPLEPPPDSEKARRAVAPGEEATLGWRPAVGLTIPGRVGWTLEGQVGTGAFGEVWTARHARTRDLRAFKFCYDADRLRGLERELTLFRLMKETLGERRDIAKLYEVRLDSPPYFLEMEYTSGGNLLQWSKGQGGVGEVPLKTRLKLAREITEALAAAHSAGVVHKNISPSNVLIHAPKSGEPEARLTDFGIGHVVSRGVLEDAGITVAGFDDAQTRNGALSAYTGTRLYMAPELVNGSVPTLQTDIYALGVLLFQMVVGDLERTLSPGWESEVSDPLLRQEIGACVARNSEERVLGADQLAGHLRSIEAGDSIAKDPPAIEGDQVESSGDAVMVPSGSSVGSSLPEYSHTAQTPPPGSSRRKNPRGWPDLSEYEIVRKIGQGGMGVVYEAIKRTTEAKCAIKILPQGAHWSDADERFRKEAKAAARLQHTNVVRVTQLKEEGKNHYYEMELIEGWAVNDLVERFSSERAHELSAAGVLEIAGVDPLRIDSRYREPNGSPAYYRLIAYWLKGVADALEYAHAQKVWHRDIKPHNLLLGHDGRMMVTDFGLAKVLGSSTETMPGTRRDGSPRYMSPEQVGAGDGEVDHRVDIYALGVTLYELLSYRRAFPGKTSQEILSQVIASVPSSPRDVVATVPSGLEAICLRAMAKKRDDRYHSAGEMRDALQAWLDADGGSLDDSATVCVSGLDAKPRRKKSGAGLFAGAVIVAVLIVSWAMGWLPSASDSPATTEPVSPGSVVSSNTNANGAVEEPRGDEDVEGDLGPTDPPPVIPTPEPTRERAPAPVRRGRILFALIEDRNTQDDRETTRYGGHWQQKLREMLKGDAAWETVLLGNMKMRPMVNALRRDAMARGADVLVHGEVRAEITSRGFDESLRVPTVTWDVSWNIEILDVRGDIIARIEDSESKVYPERGNEVPKDFLRGLAGGCVDELKEAISGRTYREGQ